MFKARLKGVWKFVAHKDEEGATEGSGSYVNIATKSNLRVNRPKVRLIVLEHPSPTQQTCACAGFCSCKSSHFDQTWRDAPTRPQ